MLCVHHISLIASLKNHTCLHLVNAKQSPSSTEVLMLHSRPNTYYLLWMCRNTTEQGITLYLCVDSYEYSFTSFSADCLNGCAAIKACVMRVCKGSVCAWVGGCEYVLIFISVCFQQFLAEERLENIELQLSCFTSSLSEVFSGDSLSLAPQRSSAFRMSLGALHLDTTWSAHRSVHLTFSNSTHCPSHN